MLGKPWIANISLKILKLNMTFSGRWLIRGKELNRIHPFSLYLISEAIKSGLSFLSWVEFFIDEKNFSEIKNEVQVIHVIPDRDKLDLQPFKERIVNHYKFKLRDSFPVEKPTSILLIFPYSLKDKRWLGMGVPPSLLFLSNSLKSYHHSVKIKKIAIESEIIPEEIENFSWVGIPLYDDLFASVRKLIRTIKGKFKGKIAVGGPMATLSPIAVSAHLPEANLIVRGEAEETFPKILSLLHDPILNLEELFKIKGFLYRDESILISSYFSEIPLPDLRFSNMDIDSIPDKELEKGLEINTSRGCPRSCIYCSHVHGRAVREIPYENIRKWLIEFKRRLQLKGIKNTEDFAVNINDDDILLNKERAIKIIKTINELGFKIWGVQTSLENIAEERDILDFLSIKDFYFYNKPLLWLGTDSFLLERRKRLGRKALDKKIIEELIQLMEEKKIKNFHYLILSDHKTDWEEFIDEIIFICELQKKYSFFEIIPTSKFLIPYPYTPSFKIIPKERIEKETLSIDDYPQFNYPLVKFAKPKNENIYALLNLSNSFKFPIQNSNFVQSLSSRNFREVFNTLYSFLKINIYNENNEERIKTLKELLENLEDKAEDFIF